MEIGFKMAIGSAEVVIVLEALKEASLDINKTAINASPLDKDNDEGKVSQIHRSWFIIKFVC